MEESVAEALEKKYIVPSISPTSARFFFVEEKDGGLRPCIDYCGLNKITVKYPYPLPLFLAALEQLRRACIFSQLDLCSGKGDEWKTAFSTTSGHYHYQVIPYGLSSAPSGFQDLINDALRNFLGKFVIAYIDDILIYSTDYPNMFSTFGRC